MTTTASVRSRMTRTAVAALLCAATVTAFGQTRYLVDEPGVWKPWKPFSAITSARTERGATPAEVKAFEATLLELNAIVRRASGVATPRGYSVQTWGNLNGYRALVPGQPAGRSLPLAGGLTFGAFPIVEYTRAGKTVREDTGETALFTFEVNELEPWLIGGPRPTEWEAVETDAFMQPQPNGEVAGIPRYGDIAVLKKNPASLWVPMPLQAALDLIVTVRETQLQERRQTAVSQQQSYDLWKTPAKRAERMASYKLAAATLPDGAKYLAGVDQQEKDIESVLAKEVGPDSQTAKGIRAIDASLAELKTWLGELSAADRQAPACYATGGAALRTRFRTGTSPACQPLARPNRQFFNASVPRSAAQVVIIGQISSCFDHQPAPTGPWGCPANRQLLQTLDQQAVLSLLK
jgi:hypothetical protein